MGKFDESGSGAVGDADGSAVIDFDLVFRRPDHRAPKNGVAIISHALIEGIIARVEFVAPKGVVCGIRGESSHGNLIISSFRPFDSSAFRREIVRGAVHLEDLTADLHFVGRGAFDGIPAEGIADDGDRGRSGQNGFCIGIGSGVGRIITARLCIDAHGDVPRIVL